MKKIKTLDTKELAKIFGGKSKGGGSGGPPQVTAESNIQQLLAALKH